MPHVGKLLNESILIQPRKLVISGWHGHVPFAVWLISTLKPRTFVELGTQQGASYLAFCEAVLENRLDTKCYAVDTWQGDEHAGFYGEEVFLELADYHDQNYGAFSRLMRMTFDEAVEYFSDKSIDLLHLDGFHTYDVAKHDFETWLPKVSACGVVLFHDINVRERGFGVWKLWEELRGLYRTIEFEHSYGLGVLFVSEELLPEAQELFAAWQNDSERVFIKRVFARLGQAILQQYELGDVKRAIAERDGHIAGLNQAIAERDKRIVDINQAVAAKDEKVALLTQTVDDLEDRIAGVQQTLAVRDAQITKANQTVADRDGEIANLQKTAAVRAAEFATLNHTITGYQQQLSSLSSDLSKRLQWALDLQKELQRAEENIREIHASSVWKITYPLRLARQLLRRSPSSGRSDQGLVWRLARRTYHALPLRLYRKQQLKGICYSLFPGVFDHLTSFQVWKAQHMPIRIPSARGEPTTGSTSANSDMPDLSKIVLPTSPNPIASVIIPAYGQLEYTMRCLRSFAVHPPRTPFEIIVVNDCSPDNTKETLESIDGLSLISNESNQGFLRTCNRGAKAARGEFLCFLNNDTEITPGWLDELVRTFEEFPGTGLVGSKLVYPDGKLQEAGGIIWRDASAWNFGKFQDPDLPVFNYAREVDYCTAASIMVPKQIFAKLGGFDERYAPIYCEDADLALQMRSAGLRVIYQPLSVAIHHEGVTCGTDTSVGLKSYQVENSGKLFERWRETLAMYQEPGQDVDRAKDRAATRRALVIDHCTPTPDQDAGSITTFNLMLLLREMGFQVTFIPEDNFLYMPDYTRDLQRCGIEVLYGPFVTSVAQHVKEWGKRYDLVVIFRPLVAERHLSSVKTYCPQAKILYHTIDLHYLRMRREADLARDEAKARDAESMRETEFRTFNACDAVIVHSTAEKEILKEHFPDSKLRVFPLVMSVKGTEVGFSQRSDIVFLGGYQHQPNVDAVKHFAKDIFPLVRERIPGVRFFVVGSNPPAELEDLANESLILTGFVEDLAPLLDKIRVAVAPLRFGAGIKGKIGTTMSMGVPCVATNIAAEGMGLLDGQHLLVADEPIRFADAVTELYNNESLWSRLHTNGLEFADHHYGIRAAWAITRDILGSLGFDVGPYKEGVRLIGPGDNRTLGPKRTVAKKPEPLRPVAVCRTREEFENYLVSEHFQGLKEIETNLIRRHAQQESYNVDGYCEPCRRRTVFWVDMLFRDLNSDRDWTPNWRERLVCPSCNLNNRQRLVATLIRFWIEASRRQPATIYLMERVTPIFEWSRREFPAHNVEGSEYLGAAHKAGETINGIRHEDVQQLSFENDSIDLIVSNDVLEHVPDPERAFAECARVLRANGELLMTVPFSTSEAECVRRAILEGEKVQHLLPAIYHGNPISEKGSLVFSDFGWDMLKMIRDSGFWDAWAEIYAAPDLGHLGGGQIVFRAKKLPDWEFIQDSLLPIIKAASSGTDSDIVSNTNSSSLVSILGEVLWHSFTIDPTIQEVSTQHLRTVESVIDRFYHGPKRPMRILELAAYAHTTGYLLARQRQAEVVLADISVDALALGMRNADDAGTAGNSVRRIAVDFHDLPFLDDQFDIVFMASALHHTWHWQVVVAEMLRVLAPGGLLYLDNEPCLREFCFYKFRTNRPDKFRPFEKCLEDIGLIRTIAEPYLGSRPESLFGMTENQKIPLDALLNSLQVAGQIVKLGLSPEVCMHTFERELIAKRHLGQTTVRQFIAETIHTGIDRAKTYLAHGDLALGYCVPSLEEVDAMADRIASRVTELVGKESSNNFRLELARLFGATVSVVLQKRGCILDQLPKLNLRYSRGDRSGVTVGYPTEIQEMLDRAHDLLPNIQTASEEALRAVFPVTDWNLHTNEHGIRYLVPSLNHARLCCKALSGAKRILVLLRVYAAFIDAPYRIHLELNEVSIAHFDVHQTDSFLIRSEIEFPGADFVLSVSGTSLITHQKLESGPPINISAVRLCPMLDGGVD